MYTAESVIERVQGMIKSKGLLQKEVLEKCDLSINSLKRMSDKNGMGSFNLAAIADYLDCSVDYLLGRTDSPKMGADAIITADNHGTQTGENNFVHIEAKPIIQAELSEDDAELLELIKSLSLVKRAQAILYINDLKEE